MSSISPLPFSTIAVPCDHHTRVLKAHIIVHILVLGTVVLLVMQLISHTTAVGDVAGVEMPPAWRDMFVRQFFEGTEVFSWVVVYSLVSLRTCWDLELGVRPEIRSRRESV
jgi:hypothetical protein